jgi:hypothetical protein
MTVATATMPSPITTQPQGGTSVPESLVVWAGATVVVWLIDVVCEGAVSVLVSMTVVEGPGTVIVRVWVGATVSVGEVVVLAA